MRNLNETVVLPSLKSGWHNLDQWVSRVQYWSGSRELYIKSGTCNLGGAMTCVRGLKTAEKMVDFYLFGDRP